MTKKETTPVFDQTVTRYMEEIRSFVKEHTGDVLKQPRSFIRFPFIDPGSIYDGNVWDWDTYWSVYGFLNLLEEYPDEEMRSLARYILKDLDEVRTLFCREEE